MAAMMDDGLQQQQQHQQLQQMNGVGATVHHLPAGANVSTKALAATHNNNNNNNISSSNNNNNNTSGGNSHSLTQHAITPNHQQPPFLCSGCARPIVDQYLLKALDCFWHEDCLKCVCCDCRLGEVGSTLYIKANQILCKRDYLRMFGTSGSCAACCKPIPAFEMVMRAKSNVYHLDCFACQQCHQRFCVGDRFYLNDNKILCEYDYEERLVAVSMPSNTSTQQQQQQHIQRRVSDIHQPGDSPLGLSPVGQSNGFHHLGGGFNSHLSEASSRFAASDSMSQQLQQHQQQQQQLQLQQQSQQVMNRHLQQHLAANHNPQQQQKHGSPSDGSSSGYGSPDSVLLDER